MKYIIFSALFNLAFGQFEKSSLTFVIDDTYSMWDDIAQVQNGVNRILDTVLNSKASPIKDFVLVTFNDPTIKFLTKTESRYDFGGALRSIKVHEGGDCAEMSMEGIYEALMKSEPGSYVYVFTDASAKDAYKLPDVQGKAIEKNIQIVFLLTGRCSRDDNDPQYQVYYKLADATSGQVFHMQKQDIKIILKYIAEQVKSSKTVITSKKFPPGHSHSVTFPVDDDMKSVIITESGNKPTIKVKSPDGSKTKTRTVVDLDDVIAVRIDATSPGNYTAVVGSRSEMSVVVTASTTIKFQHGFSPVRVRNINSTSTTPSPGFKTFLSIKLDTPDDNKIITTAELMDIKENVVSQFPLTLVDKKDKFYSTDDFVPPEFLFKVAVKGVDRRTGAVFRRISATPIEIPRIKPGIQIVGGPKITAAFKKPLKIACKVSAFPKPDVIWIDGSGKSFPSLVSTVKLLYDFIAILEIEKVTTNSTYTCKASNSAGFNSARVEVETLPKRFFNVMEAPKDTKIKYERNGHISCKVDAYLPAKLTWMANGKEVHANEHYDISEDGSELIIKNMQLKLNGSYQCVAQNGDNLVELPFKVLITGFAKPLINKNGKRIYSAVSRDLVLRIPCQVTGDPRPDLTWTRNGLNIPAGTKWYDIEADGTLIIKNIDEKAAGIYVCRAKNKAGEDSKDFQVIVRPFPDTITPTDTVNLKENATATIKCNIPHNRLDYIRWYKDGKIITEGELTLKNVKLNESGLYICRVSKFSNSKSSAVAVVIGRPPVFLEELDDFDLKLNYVDSLPTYLDCQAYGEPVPEVIWMHNGKKLTSTEMVLEFEMNLDTRGQYDCIVKNNFGTISRTFEIISRDCFLNVKEDLTEKQPLIIAPHSLQLLEFENINGFLTILSEEPLLLYCPSGFSNFPKSEVIATCDGDTNFKINGHTYKFSELACTEEIIPQIKRTGRRCSSTNSETVKIGFGFRDNFMEVYEICYDETNNIPAYAKTRVPRLIPDDAPNVNSRWISNDLLRLNIGETYTCGRQINTISSRLGRRFVHSEENRCCFKTGKLVDPADLPAGLSQKAAYTTLNVVPQWSTCGAQNWELLEKEIRNLAMASYDELVVWTGTHGQLELPNDMSVPQKITVTDSVGGKQAVPQYLWKVVQNPVTESSLAIVQLNIPHATPADAMRHMVCRDICREIPWMAKHRTWKDPTRGYTFCCSVQDFERAFRLNGLFGNNRNIFRKPFYGNYGRA